MNERIVRVFTLQRVCKYSHVFSSIFIFTVDVYILSAASKANYTPYNIFCFFVFLGQQKQKPKQQWHPQSRAGRVASQLAVDAQPRLTPTTGPVLRCGS